MTFRVFERVGCDEQVYLLHRVHEAGWDLVAAEWAHLQLQVLDDGHLEHDVGERALCPVVEGGGDGGVLGGCILCVWSGKL